MDKETANYIEDTSLDRSNNNQFYSLNTVSSLEQSSSPWGTWGRRKVPPVVAPKPGKRPPATPPLGSITEGGGSLRYASTSPWSTTSRSRDIWNIGITNKNIEEEKKLEDVWNNKEEPPIDHKSVWKKEEDRKEDQEEERRREDGLKSEEICESLVENPPNFWMDKSLNLSGWIDSSSTSTSSQHISINQHQHTHSDSGLSSLSGSLRTAMTSPLSTVSSSSNSSSKSNSRRSSSSHRSASNLSFVTVEEAIKEFDGNLQNEEEEEECSCPLESSSDENPNEVYRLPESPVNRNQTYEYRRCPESKPVLKIGPNSWIGGKLREFLGWKEIDGSQEAAIYCVKTKVVRLEESLIKLRYESEQVNSYFYSLQSKLVKCATYNQLEKYKLHIKEIEKITSLLSSLVFRKEKLKKGLEREKDYLEMHGFESKLEQVEERINEANCLKKNIEKRNNYILEYLENYLNYSELQDYKENLNLKMNLVREIRKIENDLNSGNEILVLITNIKNL